MLTSRMNQEKIGRLIAKMRKQKDLTQRELGEMVGVGYRAVSKWERGQTMPDISIINELSTILGITSDELLKGELNQNEEKPEFQALDNDQKSNKKIKKRMLLLSIPILVLIFILATLIIINNNNKPEEYTIQSLYPNEYQVDGTLKIQGDDIIIKINKIEFQDYDLCQTTIKDYEYKLILDDIVLFGVGSTNEYNNLMDNLSIDTFFKDLKINFKEPYKYNHYELKKISVNFTFTEMNNNVITKNVQNILIQPS